MCMKPSGHFTTKTNNIFDNAFKFIDYMIFDSKIPFSSEVKGIVNPTYDNFVYPYISSKKPVESIWSMWTSNKTVNCTELYKTITVVMSTIIAIQIAVFYNKTQFILKLIKSSVNHTINTHISQYIPFFSFVPYIVNQSGFSEEQKNEIYQLLANENKNLPRHLNIPEKNTVQKSNKPPAAPTHQQDSVYAFRPRKK